MKEVEQFTFMLPPDIWRKKGGPSRWKMTIEDAARRYPGATPILSTREILRMPETEAEHAERAKYFCGYTKGGPTSEELFAACRHPNGPPQDSEAPDTTHRQ